MLNPLLFIIVMKVLSRRFDDRRLPWELLYADDLVLLADSEDDLKRKLQRWKNGLEAKEMRVNVEEIKSWNVEWSSESSWFRKVPLWGVWWGCWGQLYTVYAWSGHTSAVLASTGNREQKMWRRSNARHVTREPRVWINQRRGVLNWKMGQNLNLLINFAILVMCRRENRGNL